MVHTGLTLLMNDFPARLKGKKIGVLCHSPSISTDFSHITEILNNRKDCRLAAIFGPQHGIFGQTQDNMIEWEGQIHPQFRIPVFSLYGMSRKPTAEMLKEIEALVVDLQDVGARLYTYIWTVKLCIEACYEAGIPIWILDRPNPIAAIPFDGPVLKDEYFSFVGGARIPLCHRMTMGEMALWIREKYYPGCDLNIVWMDGWKRRLMYSDTGLPWVIPSPNMPSLQTAVVYPGTVLFEGLNFSEGRGTTIPFELFGAPDLDANTLKKYLDSRKLGSCAFRVHNFIPTFNKFEGVFCNGLQIHVTDIRKYQPVSVAFEIFDAIMETNPPGTMQFNQPPYEYDYTHIPFDILSGDDGMRQTLVKRDPIKPEMEKWRDEIEEFKKEFAGIAAYPD